MTTHDSTEDFIAAGPHAEDGSAGWARRLPVRLPLRVPVRLPLRVPRRRGRSVDTAPFDTAPFDPASSPAVDAPPPPSGRRLEPTHRLDGFDLRSVAGTALLYYGCAFVVLALGVVLVWLGASMFGVVGRAEEFMRSIGFRGFHFAGFEVVMGALLLCVALVAFLTVMTVLAAAFYNLLGRPDRGVRLRLTPIVVGDVAPARAASPGNGNGSANGNGSSRGQDAVTRRPRRLVPSRSRRRASRLTDNE